MFTGSVSVLLTSKSLKIKACSNCKRLSPTHYIKRHKFSKAEKKHTRYFSDLKTFFYIFFTTNSDEYVRTIRGGERGGGWGHSSRMLFSLTFPLYKH